MYVRPFFSRLLSVFRFFNIKRVRRETVCHIHSGKNQGKGREGKGLNSPNEWRMKKKREKKKGGFPVSKGSV